MGLEFLSNSFHNERGLAVLPWRTYKNPKEFSIRHFPKAERLLIRTNLAENVTYTEWRDLPRKDFVVKFGFNTNKVKKLMKEMKEGWNTNEYRREREARFHFIIHPVLQRSKYSQIGQIQGLGKEKTEVRVSFAAKAPGTDAVHVWRLLLSKPIERNELQATIPVQHREEILKNIQAAINAICGNETLEEDKRWEACFAIRTDKPTQLEFYDFLLIN